MRAQRALPGVLGAVMSHGNLPAGTPSHAVGGAPTSPAASPPGPSAPTDGQVPRLASRGRRSVGSPRARGHRERTGASSGPPAGCRARAPRRGPVVSAVVEPHAPVEGEGRRRLDRHGVVDADQPGHRVRASDRRRGRPRGDVSRQHLPGGEPAAEPGLRAADRVAVRVIARATIGVPARSGRAALGRAARRRLPRCGDDRRPRS